MTHDGVGRAAVVTGVIAFGTGSVDWEVGREAGGDLD